MAVALMDKEIQAIKESHAADCSCQLCRAIFEIETLKAFLQSQLELNGRLVNDQAERERHRKLQKELTLGAMAAQLRSTLMYVGENHPEPYWTQAAAIDEAKVILAAIQE